MVGVGDRGEELSSLGERCAMQVDGAVSVTTQCTWPRVVTTPAPVLRWATIRDTLPPAAVEGRAMIGLPPRLIAEPRTKSICPPIPE